MVVPARRRVARRASLQRVACVCERRAAAVACACDEAAHACVHALAMHNAQHKFGIFVATAFRCKSKRPTSEQVHRESRYSKRRCGVACISLYGRLCDGHGHPCLSRRDILEIQEASPGLPTHRNCPLSCFGSWKGSGKLSTGFPGQKLAHRARPGPSA